jgi:phospholipid/cholesterol/gamma-HCH transport system substrate-binding protein
MKTTSAVVKLLIFVVIAAVSTGILAVAISNSQFQPTSTYKAVFSDATSVQSGDEVRIAGVRVGTIDGVRLYQGHLAEVTFSVNKNVSLPRNVQATLKYRDLMGQRFLSLARGVTKVTAATTPGDAAAPATSTPPSVGTLPPGGTIPQSQTTPALDLTALFNGFRPLLQAIQPSQVNQLSYEIIEVLQGEGGTVTSLLSHLASLTDTLGSRDTLIEQVITNLSNVVGALDSRSGQLGTLLDNLRSLVSGLSNDRYSIGDSLVSINSLINTTGGLVTDVRPSVKVDISDLNSLSKILANSAPELNQAFAKMPVNFSVLDRSASYGSWFNFYLCGLNANIGLIGQAQYTTPSIVNGSARCQ